MKINDLLLSPESKTLEFKRSLESPQRILQTIVAFANTAGGTLLIGVTDDNHDVRGIEDPLSQEERLANLIADRIEPRLVPDLEVLAWRSKSLLAVTVHPGANRPYYLKKEGLEKGCYVRVGSTNRRADAALVEEMRRSVLKACFDEEAMTELNSEAIDFRAASELLAPVRKLRKQDLKTLRFMTDHQGKPVPTVGGILLAGADRLLHFPDAWIQVGRFEGENRASIRDHAELKGGLVQGIEEAMQFVQKHMERSAEFDGAHRKDRWTVPLVALREAIVNAVVHADYSQQGAPIRIAMYDDRIEIENPGLLPFGLALDDLTQGVSRVRNRVLARVFHDLGLIEQWGSGIQRMYEACKKDGLPQPVFEEIGLRFRVTFSTQRNEAIQLNEIEQEILRLLSSKEGRSTHEVATAIKRSSRATRTRLAELVERGLVRVVGSGPRDPKRRYYRVLES
jgi:ATP-dependent DNA helicase RecG